jgi:hypothetical protein
MPAFLTTSGRGYDEQGCGNKFSTKRKRVASGSNSTKSPVYCVTAVMRSFLFSCMCIANVYFHCQLLLSASQW